MAYSPPASVIAATPMGLRGEPPGIMSGSEGLSRLTSAGGDQAGLRYLPSIRELPLHAAGDPLHFLPRLVDADASFQSRHHLQRVHGRARGGGERAASWHHRWRLTFTGLRRERYVSWPVGDELRAS